MTRKPWKDYWLDIAEMVATRATCPRLQVGAVLVLDNRALATGFNGSHPGSPHCDEDGCLTRACPVHTDHCVRTIHAEQNVLTQVSRLHALLDVQKAVPFYKTTLYSTHEPCPRCRMSLWQKGIRKFEWREPYRDDYGRGDCTLLN